MHGCSFMSLPTWLL